MFRLWIQILKEYFTKHGLNLNLSGKEQITLKRAAVVKSLVNRNKSSSIHLQWKENSMSLCHGCPKETIGNGVSELSLATQVPSNLEGTAIHTQLNKRQRKNPALRDQDFLW